jgi:hypothetical protein
MRNTRDRGARLLPYMDDFTFMVDSRAVTFSLHERVEAVLHRLGLHRNPMKGLWESIQDDHLGLTIILLKGEFRAPTQKIRALSKHASTLLRRVAINIRW